MNWQVYFSDDQYYFTCDGKKILIRYVCDGQRQCSKHDEDQAACGGPYDSKSHMMRVTRKQTLRSLSLSYQKHDTNFSRI